MDANSKLSLKLSDKKRALLEKLLQQEGMTVNPKKRIPARTEQGPPPVSAGQFRLWLLEQLYPGLPTFNLATCFDLEGTLNLDALVRAIDEMSARNEILRTYIVGKTKPRQQIMPSLIWREEIVHLEDMSPEDAVAHAYQESKKLAGQSFDISTGPLFRIKLFRIAERRHVLFFVFHHIIFDGWSNRIYFAEFSKLYDHFADGKPMPEAGSSIQYADFAQWQKSAANKEELEEHRAFWRGQMVEAPPAPEAPADLPARIASKASGRNLMPLGSEMTRRIKSFQIQQSSSTFMVLLAAFQILLERFSGQEDICLCSPMACRNQVDIENVLGFFNNIVLLRTDLSGNPTAKELLDQVKKTTIQTGKYATLPFQEVGTLPSLARFPLSRIMFVVQKSPRTVFKLSSLSAKILDLHNGCHNFDFSLILEEEENNNLTAVLDYRSGLLSREGADALLADYRNILEVILTDPNRRLHDFPALSIRRAVDVDDGKSAGNGRTIVPPKDESERRMAELWKEILAVDRLGVTDNFFSLAGNSLQALRLWERLGFMTDHKMPIATLAAAPTIQKLCAEIRKSEPEPYGSNNHDDQPGSSTR